MPHLPRLLKAPICRFLIAGAVVFALYRPHPPNRTPDCVETDDPRAIVVSPAPRDGRTVDELIDEEILVREAKAAGLDRRERVLAARLTEVGRFLGLEDDGIDVERRARDLDLDRGDPVVRRHLATQMRLLLSRLEPEDWPGDDALAARLAADAERFRVPERVRLTHVFLSRDRHGAALNAAAERLRATLVEGAAAPSGAPAFGDPFAHGSAEVLASAGDLDRRFGPGFADAVARVPVRQWTGPIASAYGLHLVWVHERLAGGVPAIDQVRDRLLHRVLAERRDTRFRARLAALRERYRICVKPS